MYRIEILSIINYFKLRYFDLLFTKLSIKTLENELIILLAINSKLTIFFFNFIFIVPMNWTEKIPSNLKYKTNFEYYLNI